MTINGDAFNTAECLLWFVIAIVLAVKSTRDAVEVRRILRMLAVTFFAFGVSDVIEAYTGAWWTPLWLLFLKIVCIVLLVFGFMRYRHIKRSEVRR